MNISARIDKVFRDIWDNKKRSTLVVVTLAIGIAAVGVINNTVRMMERDMFDRYADRRPAQLTLYISPFPESLARDVAGMREVRAAEARRSATVFTTDTGGERRDVNLLTASDFKALNIDRVTLDAGLAEPRLRGVLLERNSASSLGLKVGDALPVETESGERYSLTVDGIIHDMTVQPYSISGEVQGYVTPATLDWLGEGAYYNRIQVIVAADQPSREQVLEVGALARDRIIEPGGYRVAAIQMRGDPQPGDFWAKKQVDGVLFVLQVMSILAVALSAGLVVNTISAVLVQQTRQIGIMRSLGATRVQITLQYLGYVLILSLFALAVAVPLGMLGAAGLTLVAADFLNFNITALDLPPSILFLQIGLGLSLPLGSALFPILRSARMSVYDAVYQNGAGSGERRKSPIERALVRIRSLSPPVMLSLRNTFRNPARLGFTLATLTIAGATFMAVFSSYSTIRRQVDELGRYIAFDASLSLPQGANKYTVEREALRIPEIQVAEGWASADAVITHPDGKESDRVEVVGIPPDAKTIQPRLVAGRWLDPAAANAVVVNEDLISKEPDVTVGKPLKIKINGQERQVTVIGVASKHMTGSRIYMDYDQLTRLTGRRNQVQTVRVLARTGAFSEPAEQTALGRRLEKRFEDAQIAESASRTRAEIFSAMSTAFNILLIILLLVALILAIIGGLGLTGAMGLNVLERTREIGVLRAIGASHESVRKVVVIEGAVVALVSWLFSALLSYPIGFLLAGAVVQMAFGTQATFTYSYLGPVIWFGTVTLIGVLASLAPARDAVRLTVREVLNYE